jgi:hypothetical protein
MFALRTSNHLTVRIRAWNLLTRVPDTPELAHRAVCDATMVSEWRKRRKQRQRQLRRLAQRRGRLADEGGGGGNSSSNATSAASVDDEAPSPAKGVGALGANLASWWRDRKQRRNSKKIESMKAKGE